MWGVPWREMQAGVRRGPSGSGGARPEATPLGAGG